MWHARLISGDATYGRSRQTVSSCALCSVCFIIRCLRNLVRIVRSAQQIPNENARKLTKALTLTLVRQSTPDGGPRVRRSASPGLPPTSARAARWVHRPPCHCVQSWNIFLFLKLHFTQHSTNMYRPVPLLDPAVTVSVVDDRKTVRSGLTWTRRRSAR